jgi:MFS family permease
MNVLRPRVGARWFALFTLAWLALWTVQLTPLQLLIPLQLNTPDDADGWIAGVVWSGLVLAVGGVAAVIAGPVAGGLSDRTRSRYGRRRPWAIGGIALASLSLLALAVASGPWGVGLAWVGVSVGAAVAASAFTALIADQLTSQRGAASAAVASSQAVGIVLGVGAIVLLGLGVVAGYVVLAGFLAIAGIAAAVLLPDPVAPAASPTSAADADARAGRAGRTLAQRTAALRDHDFAWLLGGRLVVNIGNALGTGLLLFFLLYGLDRPPADAEEDLLLLIVVYTVFVVIASIVAGRLSDRTGRRVLPVVLAALIQAAASLLLAAAPSFTTALVSAALLGVGYGGYMSVGLALATDLLPFEDDHARDLGFVNVAASLGQLLGPLLGAGLVAVAGDFWLLFATGGVLSIAGGLMTLAIRPRGARPVASSRGAADGSGIHP